MAAMKQVGGIWMLRRKKSNEYFGITLIRPFGHLLPQAGEGNVP